VILTLEVIPLSDQSVHLQRYEIGIGIHQMCNFLAIIALIDILEELVSRQVELGSKHVCFVFHALVLHVEQAKLLKAAAMFRDVSVEVMMAQLVI